MFKRGFLSLLNRTKSALSVKPSSIIIVLIIITTNHQTLMVS